MSTQLLCISHKTADVSIRSKFAFDDETRDRILKKIMSHPYISEAVLIATCNRTELYCETDGMHIEDAVLFMQKVMLCEAGAENIEKIHDAILRYQDSGTVHHLFLVAAGLDSVIVGEDQILGQVKNAYLESSEKGFLGQVFNSLFQAAMAAAKKIKTDTPISRVPVSAASLALKQAQKEFDTLLGRNIMIIGASGKMGNIVMRDAADIAGLNVFVTARNHIPEKNAACKVINYADRYEYLKKMDIVISATKSPHYTVTRQRIEQSGHKEKAVFVDLAVPFDIDPEVEKISGIKRYSMEDMDRIARQNNELKKSYAADAKEIINRCEQDYIKNEIFRKNREKINEIADEISGKAKTISKMC